MRKRTYIKLFLIFILISLTMWKIILVIKKEGYVKQEKGIYIPLKGQVNSNININLIPQISNILQEKSWQKTYGGSGYDSASSIQQTKDGGYIFAGWTESSGAGGKDVYIIKLDKNGNKVWEKTYGGSGDDSASSIQQTSDGGYIVAGWTRSFGAGGSDIYIIKLDGNGNSVWERTYGGIKDDEAYSIQQTTDGGYIFAGWTESLGAGGRDVYIIKLDENGNKIWEKTFGGSDWDTAYSIQQTTDGGYIVAGRTDSFGEGYWDVYIIKLDKFGNAKNNLIISIKKIEEKVRSSMKTMQTALEMYATDNNGNYTDNLLNILSYLPCGLFPKHPLTNKPYEIGINLFDPVNGGSPVKNSSDVKYQYAIVYKYDASNHTYTFIGYDQTNTKIIYIITGGGE
jgi:type II secretory pathway pseudopilin PulG